MSATGSARWVVRFDDANLDADVYDQNDNLVLSVHGNTLGDLIDNANMAAAAPDLYRALEKLFAADMARCMLGDGKDDQVDALEAARTAMIKAAVSDRPRHWSPD